MKRHFDTIGFHFLTFGCFKGNKYFRDESLYRLMIEHLDSARQRRNFLLIAFVIMPDHVHLLLRLDENDTIAKTLISVKKSFSYEAFRKLPVIDRESANNIFWQPGGGYDRNITSMLAVKKTIDYINMNPVRKGLVKKPEDWKWSSARFWILGESDPLRIDIPELL